MLKMLCRLTVLAIFAVPVLAQDFTIKVEQKDGAPAVTDFGALVKDGTTNVSTGAHQITLKCTDAATCSGLSVTFGGKELCKPTATDTSCTKAITNLGSGGDLIVQNATGKALFTTTLAPPAGDKPKSELMPLLRTPCDIDKIGGYDRQKNLATFVTDVLGNVRSGPGEAVDENDTVRVILYADTRLQPLLHVFRKSAIRTSGTINLAGAGLTVSLPKNVEHTLERTEGKCTPMTFDLNSFAPGTGVVEIDVQTDQGAQTLGSFDFDVHKLYNGIISAGFANGDLSDRTFKLLTQGDKKLIYSTEEGKGSSNYALFLTGFLRPRDLEKSANGLKDVIAPTIGMSLNKPSERAFAGLSLNWRIIVITVGEEFAKVNRLSTSSALKEGDAFTGAEADIPTSKQWKHGRFYAVSVDLRAVTQFLSAFGSTAAK